MKRLKRASALATMVATGLIGIAVVGAGSASADVLCKDVAFNNNCSTENTYGVGTEFHADTAKIVTLKASGFTLFTCASSEMDLTVIDAGGADQGEYPELDITNLTLESCGDDPTTALSGGSATIAKEAGASQQGRFLWSGEQIKTTTNAIRAAGSQCTYSIEDAGKLAGWKTVENQGTTQIVFKEAEAKLVGSPHPWLCFGAARFSATYDIDLYPQGIYVTSQ